MSNLGKWSEWYKDLDSNTPSAFRYGDTETYPIAATFLQDCELVEDWGCGAGGFKRYRTEGYRGIDGSQTPFADVIADLRTYRSDVDGILIRHVLEHDTGWRDILENAVASCRKKLCLVLFTPFSEATQIIAQNINHGIDVPDISFCKNDIESFFIKCQFNLWTMETATGYGIEHMYRVIKHD